MWRGAELPDSNAIQPSGGMNYISSLDGIRGLAILLVFFIHLQQSGVVPANLHLVNALMHCGWCGVDLFFVLSGFLITLGLLESKGSVNYFSAFYMRRILRIFPLYYAVLAAAIIGGVIFSSYPISPSWAAWLSHALFLQNWWMPWLEPTSPNILGHFWSLGVEEQFYLVWPLCVWLLPRRYLPGFCIAICAAVLALRFFLVQYYNPFPQILLMNTATRADTLIVGALCAVVTRDRTRLARVRRWLPAVAVLAFSFLVVMFFGIKDKSAQLYYTDTLGFTALALTFGPLVLWAYLFRGSRNWYDRLLSLRPLTNAGKYSYGLYVYHLPVIFIAKMLFDKKPWFGHDILPGLLFCFCAVAVAICVAVASYELFEKRFLRLKRYFKPRYESVRQQESSMIDTCAPVTVASLEPEL